MGDDEEGERDDALKGLVQPSFGAPEAPTHARSLVQHTVTCPLNEMIGRMRKENVTMPCKAWLSHLWGHQKRQRMPVALSLIHISEPTRLA